MCLESNGDLLKHDDGQFRRASRSPVVGVIAAITMRPPGDAGSASGVIKDRQAALLLDDVFSELDTQRREHLLRHVLQHEQILLTATDLSSFPQEVLGQAKLYKVEHGTLLKTSSDMPS